MLLMDIQVEIQLRFLKTTWDQDHYAVVIVGLINLIREKPWCFGTSIYDEANYQNVCQQPLGLAISL